MLREPIPAKVYTSLRFVTFPALYSNNALGQPNSQVFRTSIWDPDWTNVGNQPLWYSHFASVYNKYRVHGIKYKMTVTNTNANQLTQMVVMPKDNNIAITDFAKVMESRDARIYSLAEAGRPRTFKGYIPTGKAFGLSKKEMLEDEDFIAPINDNPAKMTYVHFVFNSMAGAQNCFIDISTQYWLYVEFLDRKLAI